VTLPDARVLSSIYVMRRPYGIPRSKTIKEGRGEFRRHGMFGRKRVLQVMNAMPATGTCENLGYFDMTAVGAQ
jgi:hypothetical protein